MKITITRDTSKRETAMERRKRVWRELARRPGVRVMCDPAGRSEKRKPGGTDARNVIAWRCLRKGGHAPGVVAGGMIADGRVTVGGRAGRRLTPWQRKKLKKGELSIASFSASARKAYYREMKRAGKFVRYAGGARVGLSDADRDRVWASTASLREQVIRGQMGAPALCRRIGDEIVRILAAQVPSETGQLRKSLQYELTGSAKVGLAAVEIVR